MAQKQYHARAPGASSQLTTLVKKARGGNKAAFEQLVDLFQEDIFRMVYYRIRSAMDAEDLTQEIFIQAFRNLSRLKKVERFRSWLFTIAINRVRDFSRRRRFLGLFSAFTYGDKETQADVETMDNPDAMDNLIRQDFWKQVGLFLDNLSRMEREVFLLRFMDHLNIKEISLALKKSESTVKTHLYRAIQKFKKESSIYNLLQEETL
jgi:RNA polymerase sigma-70 factor (ECF subfamily)